MTSAHCVRNYGANISNLVVVVGITSLTESLKASNVFFVLEIIYNSLYNSLHLKNGNDIALIKLFKPVEVSAKVATICLPYFNEYDNKSFILAGW